MNSAYTLLTGPTGAIEARATTADGPGDADQARAKVAYAVHWLGLEAGYGMTIDHETSLAYSAVWGCVRAVCQGLCSVGWHAYEKQADGRTRLPIEDNEAWLLDFQANPEMSSFSFREKVLKDALTWGNAYAEIERTGTGKARWLWPLAPGRCDLVRDEDSKDKDLWLRVDNGPHVEPTWLPYRDVFHLKGLGPDGLVGYSVIELARRAIKLGLQEEKFGSKVFGSGTLPSGFLKVPQRLNDAQHRELKRSFEAAYSGDENHMGVVILHGGAEFTAGQLPNDDAQFLESRRFQVNEICFVPGTKVVTIDGVTPIEEVQEGRLVLTHKGRWRKVVKAMVRDYAGDVVTMHAKGLEAVTATPNHPMYAQAVKPNRSHRLVPDGAPAWVAAGELEARAALTGGGCSRRRFMNLTMPMIGRAGGGDYSLAWLCGLYAADGSATTRQTVFYIGAHEPKVTQRLRDFLGEQFRRPVSTTAAQGGSVHRTVVGGPDVASLFAKFGSSSHEKRLPDWCMAAAADFDFRRGLVDGLVAGDGHERRRCRQLRTTSVALAWQLRLLLWADGVNSSLMTAPPGRYKIEGREGDAREIYTVEWQAEKGRRGTMGVGEGVVYFSLDGVTRTAYAGPVYNLQVEEDETYTTTGGIAHNCRWFGVPPHKLADLERATFSNVEEQERAFVTDCLLPWARRLETEADVKLYGPVNRGRKFTKLNLDALMRGNSTTQTQTLTSQVASGLRTVNEGRGMLDLNPIEGGDTPLIQGAMVPLERVLEEPEEPEPPEPPEPEEGDEGEGMDGEDEGEGEGEDAATPPGNPAARIADAVRVFGGLLADAYGRLLRVEADKAARALKQGKLAAHVADFYAGHEAHVAAALLPAFEGFLLAAGGTPARARELAAAAAHAHAERSRTELLAHGEAVLPDWQAGRALEQAALALADAARRPL